MSTPKRTAPPRSQGQGSLFPASAPGGRRLDAIDAKASERVSFSVDGKMWSFGFGLQRPNFLPEPLPLDKEKKEYSKNYLTGRPYLSVLNFLYLRPNLSSLEPYA